MRNRRERPDWSNPSVISFQRNVMTELKRKKKLRLDSSFVSIRSGAQQTDLNREVGRVLTKAADQSRRRYFYAQPRTSYLTELADRPAQHSSLPISPPKRSHTQQYGSSPTPKKAQENHIIAHKKKKHHISKRGGGDTGTREGAPGLPLSNPGPFSSPKP